MKKRVKRILITSILLLLPCILWNQFARAYTMIADRQIIKEHWYVFSTEKILKELTNEESLSYEQTQKIIFPMENDIETAKQYTIENYDNLVEEFHDEIWGNDLAKLNKMLVFSTWECGEENYLTSVSYQYGKLKWFDDINIFTRTLTTSELHINGLSGYARVLHSRERIFSILGFLKIMPMNAISAYEALQIAEENGGSEIKEKYNNQCTINVVFYPQNQQKWEVSYFDKGKNNDESGLPIAIAYYLINPITGRIIK